MRVLPIDDVIDLELRLDDAGRPHPGSQDVCLGGNVAGSDEPTHAVKETAQTRDGERVIISFAQRWRKQRPTPYVSHALHPGLGNLSRSVHSLKRRVIQAELAASGRRRPHPVVGPQRTERVGHEGQQLPVVVQTPGAGQDGARVRLDGTERQRQAPVGLWAKLQSEQETCTRSVDALTVLLLLARLILSVPIP